MSNKVFSDLLASNSSLMAAYTKMLSESTQSEEDDDSDARHQGWRERVRAAHPGKNLIFRSKNTGGEMMISAEEHGDKTRKAYGLYNMKTNEGHIFHDDLNEETMTDAQKARREEIVKGMKDNLADFKKRYGDDAESVMYATATKKAMEESYCGEAQGVHTSTVHFGKKFDTVAFDTPDQANAFMSTKEGSKYGHLKTDENGRHHLARLDDEGQPV